MDEYLAISGRYGRHMMRASASTQVSIDYSSEEDAVRKMRVAQALSPVFALHFANTPVFGGAPSPYKLLRTQMWEDLDPARAGTVPFLFEDSFGFEKVAEYVLNSPLMVADFTITPEIADVAKNASADSLVYSTLDTATNLYPHRALNSEEIAHILSTYFFDVRLKNFIELRSVDSLPIERALEYAQYVQNIFYNDARLREVQEYIGEITGEDVHLAKQAIEADGEGAEIYGRSYADFFSFVFENTENSTIDNNDNAKPGTNE
jgi:glutamate--cysteine ligase